MVAKIILLLEDDRENRNVIAQILRTDGFAVIEATTGKQVAELCASGAHFDLFVADLVVPDASGARVALDLIESCPHLPVLFVSGTPLAGWPPEDIADFHRFRPEAVAFLAKPFFPTELRAAVRELLNVSEKGEHHICEP